MVASALEGLRMKLRFILSSLILVSCTSSYLKYDKIEQLNRNDEFEKQVKINTIDSETKAPSQPTEPTEKPAAKPATEKKTKAQKKAKKKKTTKTAGEEKSVATRQPDIEDSEGFGTHRRPAVDPFRVGEEVVHNVHYFKVSAGELALKVEPFVEVNGRKAYSFATEIRSSRVFSTFYSIDDRVVTLVDYDQMVPRAFTMHVKESGQLRQARSFFDFEKMKATYWEKKVTQKSGEEEKKLEWDILEYSQNVFSIVFYMRAFKWEIGKTYSFRVAHDGENLVFKGTALRKEKLDTDIGELPAIVVKPEIMVKGIFKPVGDIYIWLSDDERKYVLRIESSIKIGTIVSEVIRINPGQP